MSLDDVGKIESSIAALVEAQSFLMWMLAGFLSYILDTYVPPDKQVFDKFCSSISLSMVDQNTAAASLQSFFALLRKDLYLQHCPPTLNDDQRSKLLNSSPFSKDLFDSEVLQSVIDQHKGDSATAANVAISKHFTGHAGSVPSFKKKDPAAVTQGPSSSGAAMAGTPLGDSRSSAPSPAPAAPYKSHGKQRWKGKKGKGPSLPKNQKPPGPGQNFGK